MMDEPLLRSDPIVVQNAVAFEPGKPASPSPAENPVILFDGACGLCNAFVDFVLRRDRGGVFRFAPLQGMTAVERLPASDLAELKTVILLEGGKEYRKSDAALRVLSRLGPGWRIASALAGLVPRAFRDLVYSLVARYRYAIFGKKETCRIPNPEERSRFLP